MDILNTLLEITIYSGIIYIVTVLLKKRFKNKMSPLLHYAVWIVLIVRLMMPVTLTSPVHLFVIPTESQNQTAVVQPQTYEPVAVPEVSKAGETSAQTLIPEISQKVQNETETKTSLTVQKPAILSLSQIILLIWLVGMGICLLYLVALYAALRRKFRRNAAYPSKRLAALFEEIKAEMGIKANIKLVCQYEYGTPSLMFPKTIMMPVDALVAMNDEQAKFALRHELTHYKRCDQIMSILLSLLNAVYWFNPFVWIAFRQIRTDMEIACDSAVVKRLDTAGKNRYALLIVNLFAQPVHRQLVLGMAQADAKKVAEQRVRGIFMKGKSKRSVKLISALLVTILLFACFTTACQPTPEKPVVVGKGDGALEAAIQESGAPVQKYEAPEHWADSTEIADLSVTIDADVTVPDVENFPVGVVAPDEITQAQADKIMQVLLQGATLYEQGPDESVVTKDQIMEQIVNIQKDISDPNSDFNTKTEKGTPEYEEGLASRENQIKSLQKAYETAPDTIPEPNPASTKFEQNKDSNMLAPVDIPDDATEEEREALEAENKDKQEHSEKYLPYEITGIATLEDGRTAYLSITQSTGDYGSARAYFGAGAEVIPESMLMGRYGNVPAVPCETTQEQAAKLALQTIRDLGLNDFGIAATQTGYIIEQDPKTYEALSKRECHIFIFTRTLNGVLVNHALYIEPQDMQYADTLPYEGVQIIVSEQGVISFSWMQPMKLLNIENESVSLKSFSEIQEVFKKQITIKGAWNSSTGQDKNVISRRIVIEEVRLGLMRTVRKDRPGEYLLLPVWDFYGYEVNKCKEQKYQGPKLDENNEYTVREFGRSYLTINAIDGSVIDRGLGY